MVDSKDAGESAAVRQPKTLLTARNAVLYAAIGSFNAYLSVDLVRLLTKIWWRCPSLKLFAVADFPATYLRVKRTRSIYVYRPGVPGSVRSIDTKNE